MPVELAGVALITIWFDLQSDNWWDANNGSVFCLRTYPSLDGLVPLGPSQHAKGGTLPILPVRWRIAEADGPSWDDIGFPRNVAAWPDASWFFHNNHANFQTKVGGWPAWAQSGQGADGFMLQIDSEQRGHIMWGDSGHTFFFLENGQWRIRGDCY